jgi:(p)ppGpp synthase/HD superfamily hydrolase
VTDKQILEEIRNFADRSHGDQMRKYTPERYIVHPVRVMNILEEYTSDTTVLAAALLHDVLEDTPVTREEIKQFLLPLLGENKTNQVISLVVELTDVYIKKDYPQLNRKKRKELELDRVKHTSRNAQTIKYADIIDNCNEIVKHDRHFAGVFLNECYKMVKAADLGDFRLYKRTKDILEEKLKELKK